MKRVVTVIFNDTSSDYSYFTDIDGLKKGDLVVVPVSNFAHDFGYSIAKIYHVDRVRPEVQAAATKWIVQKVDTDI